MASTAPSLTWSLGAEFTPAATTTTSSIMTAIGSALTASDWSIEASAADYYLISPPAGSGVASLRILIAGDATGPNSANMSAPHTTAANRIYIGLAPDSGKNALTNAWNSASNPFDTDRWTEYAKLTGNIASTAIDTVFCIWSSESIGFFFHNSAGDDYYGGIAGAIIDPPFDADGEGTPGRVYGISVSGEAQISTTFLNGTSEWLGDGTNQNAQTRVFDPTSSTNLIHIDKTSINIPANPRLLTPNNNTIPFPIVAYREASPNTMLGIYRQIGAWSDARVRQILQDGTPTNQGYFIGAQKNSDADAALFYNKS